MRINDLPIDSKPREKALKKGIGALGDDELLALIIGNGVKGHNALEIAQEMLVRYGCLASLSSCLREEYSSFDGISKARSLTLSAVFELGKRVSLEEENNMPQTSYSLSIRHRDEKIQECLFMAFLDRKYRLVKEKMIYKGTENCLPLSSKEILSEALASKAFCFALIHNHPSGKTLPSKEDVDATLSICKKCNDLGVRFFDHIIVGDKDYFSFAENGLLH